MFGLVRQHLRGIQAGIVRDAAPRIGYADDPRPGLVKQPHAVRPYVTKPLDRHAGAGEALEAVDEPVLEEALGGVQAAAPGSAVAPERAAQPQRFAGHHAADRPPTPPPSPRLRGD